ncbi:MAG: tRNA uridine-5-carboxymethylaminomethyl(34) synthesis GTPase MnmE [Desulfomonilaceae bacterium]
MTTDQIAIETETIAAISTAPGHAGIGVIRISGPGSIPIITRLFKPAKSSLRTLPDRHAIYGRFVPSKKGTVLDDGFVVVVKGPNSYTGEDVVELSLHGSPVVLHEALMAILDAGARQATRGEFTRRAFLNGKLDLVQAEAVVDLIMASTFSAADEARSRLDKRLSSEVQNAIDSLTDIIAEVEANIEFAEDLETEDLTPQNSLIEVQSILRRLTNSGASGRFRREGISVAIVGKPNVGKSTLFNALLGEDRMIATPYPGTTRDAVSEKIVIDGKLFNLCDTAGLRDDPDPVEEEGIKRTRDWIQKADLALLVIDASLLLDDYDEWAYKSCGSLPKILVLNKADLPSSSIDLSIFNAKDVAIVRISARTGFGLDTLKAAIFDYGERILASSDHSLGCWLNQRCLALVQSASSKIDALMELLTTGNAPVPEILSLELNSALKDLLEITGAGVDESVLDRIFERFCVGK